MESAALSPDLGPPTHTPHTASPAPRPSLGPLTCPLCVLCFLVRRDIQQETFRASHAHWRGFSFVYNHYLFSGCFLVVLLAILLYLLRLRRIHRRTSRSGSAAPLWLEEGLPAQKIAGTL